MKWTDFFKSKSIDPESDMPDQPEQLFIDQDDKGKDKPENDENTAAMKDLTAAVKSLEEANRELAVLGQQTAEVEDFDHALAAVVGLTLED